MNRRTFTASLAGLLGVVGLGAKAKAAPKQPKPAGRTLNARGPVTIGAESNNFDTVNIYPGGSVSFEGGPKITMHSPTGSVTIKPPDHFSSRGVIELG